MTDPVYDIAIVGGGIHGVGVAEEATKRGLSVILLEQYSELAEGTSSRSSKLIHGGLRYLESFQFSLVEESLQERKYHLERYPELVTLKPFYIPVYRSSSRSVLKIWCGLLLYWVLSRFSKDARFQRLRKSEWETLPGLRRDGLQAVFQYADAQTDDRALVREVMKRAVNGGAKLLTGAEVEHVDIQGESTLVSYQIKGERHTLFASAVVNATGPWVNMLLEKVTPLQEPMPIDLIKGSHIELPISVSEGILYVESPQDGRPVFFMPWKGGTLVGTTEVYFHGDPAEVQPTPEEIEYLFGTFSFFYPETSLTVHEVTASWAGIRVLPKKAGAINRRSRETVLQKDRSPHPRLVSLYGGKLTTYRATARKILEALQ